MATTMRACGGGRLRSKLTGIRVLFTRISLLAARAGHKGHQGDRVGASRVGISGCFERSAEPRRVAWAARRLNGRVQARKAGSNHLLSRGGRRLDRKGTVTERGVSGGGRGVLGWQ